MNKVLDSLEYIIEPGTKVEDVTSFFTDVRWTVNRVSGLARIIYWANAYKQCYVVYLKDNVPYIKSLKEARDGQAS